MKRKKKEFYCGTPTGMSFLFELHRRHYRVLSLSKISRVNITWANNNALISLIDSCLVACAFYLFNFAAVTTFYFNAMIK